MHNRFHPSKIGSFESKLRAGKLAEQKISKFLSIKRQFIITDISYEITEEGRYSPFDLIARSQYTNEYIIDVKRQYRRNLVVDNFWISSGDYSDWIRYRTNCIKVVVFIDQDNYSSFAYINDLDHIMEEVGNNYIVRYKHLMGIQLFPK